jgi:antitoxin component YwqK of YwqJK toxin-antitoxin module
MLFDENGTMKKRRYISPNGKLEGPHEMWYENGNPRELEHYSNGKIEGERKEWYENNRLKTHQFYHNDHLEGESKVWHENGQLASVTMFHNGNEEGERKTWYADGQPWQFDSWYQGMLEGERKWWHPNGKPWVHAFYRNNKKDGEMKVWSDDGTLTSHEFYRNGKLVKVISPLAKCHEKTDSIATGEDLTANTVIIFSPFRKNDESECYSYDSWEGFIKSETGKKVFIWERGLGALKYAPVIKLPYSGVWVQSTYNLLTRFNTFILKSIGNQLIGSSFGVSQLHGATEHVYIAIPINRKQAMNVPDIKDIDETVFVPDEEDYIDQDNYKPNTIVQITRGGTFAETNRSTGEVYGYWTQKPGKSITS